MELDEERGESLTSGWLWGPLDALDALDADSSEEEFVDSSSEEDICFVHLVNSSIMLKCFLFGLPCGRDFVVFVF
jgi:hypothetical protein